jgi:hypothetical protein
MFPVMTPTVSRLVRPLATGLGVATLAAGLAACGSQRDVTLASQGAATTGGCVSSGDASVCVDENGGKVAAGDATVTVGPDGGKVSAGDATVTAAPGGGGVSAGGSSVGVGGGSSGPATAGGHGPESGGGERVGTFGATGQVTVTGPVAQRGSVTKGKCEATSDVRTLTATLPRGGRLIIDVIGPTVGDITLTTASGEWTGKWVGNLEDVFFMSPTGMRVDGASLAGDGTVKVSGTFDC